MGRSQPASDAPTHPITDPMIALVKQSRQSLREMTFAQTTPPLPPVMRIDRSLTGPHAVDARIRSEVGMGRGPRDLIATVAFPPT